MPKPVGPKGIRSVCWEHHGGTDHVLVGTDGSEIYQLCDQMEFATKVEEQNDFADQQPDRFHPQLVVGGHFVGSKGSGRELWGLAAHPTNVGMVATCGDDGTVRVWHRQACIAIGKWPETPARSGKSDRTPWMRAVTWSPTGKWLIVGLAANIRRGKGKSKQDGNLVVFEFAEQSATSGETKEGVMRTMRPVEQNNGSIMFDSISKNRRRGFEHKASTLLAVPHSEHPHTQVILSCHDGRIYLFKLDDTDGKLVRERVLCRNRAQAIYHTDVGRTEDDSLVIRTNTNQHSVLFFDANSGRQITRGPVKHNIRWDTNFCPISWGTQGAIPVAHTDWIKAADRSNDLSLVAVGFKDKSVKLYNYPCTKTGADNLVQRGHANMVTSVRFAQGDRSTSFHRRRRRTRNTDNVMTLYTIGGEDRTLLEWSINSSNEH